MAIRKISNRDEDGAIDFTCSTATAVADWAAGCAAVAPEGYGAGSTMTIVDETTTPPSISGIGWFSGLVWAEG